MKDSMQAMHDNSVLLADLLAQSDDLRQQINHAESVIALAAVAKNDVETLRQQRRTTLGAKYLGKGSDADVRAIDDALRAAEEHAKASGLLAEAADAAIDQLEAEHIALQEKIRACHAARPALLYVAHTERAVDAMIEYHDACKQLAGAKAKLQGACLAADQFADVRSDPRRLFTVGNGGITQTIVASAPNLPGAESYQWTFDLRTGTEAALDAALSTVGSKEIASEIVRQRVDAAVDQAEQAMRAALAKIGAA